MTLKDLAKEARVSVSTVSKAFSDSREISEEKRNEIFALAKKNGCFEKYYKGKFGKKIVAVICPEIRGAFYTEFAAMLCDAIDRRGGMMLLSVTNFDARQEEALIQYYTSNDHADGIILFGGFDLKQEPHIPVVAVGSSMKRKYVDSLNTDLSTGIDEAVEYLKEMGHREIGFLWEKHTMLKYRRFCESMRKYGLLIHEEYCVQSDRRFESAGYSAMKALMERSNPPTAVIASYDHMALGAIRYAQEAGISIPEDVSIIGMDNISTTAYLDVSLTTVLSLDEELCETAVDLIFKKMDNRYYRAKQEITLKSRLIKRESVAKIKPSHL